MDNNNISPCGPEADEDELYNIQTNSPTVNSFMHSEVPLPQQQQQQQQQYVPAPTAVMINENVAPQPQYVAQPQQPTLLLTNPVVHAQAAAPQPTGAVEWKMLEIDVSAAASIKHLDQQSRVWSIKFSDMIDMAPWKEELMKSRQRIGGLEILEAQHSFPFQLGVRLVLPDATASTTSSSRIGAPGSGKNSSNSNNKLPVGKYIVTSKEPTTFTLRTGQVIKSKDPVRILVAPDTLERSILSSYGTREGSQEPIWTPSNLRSGISPQPRQPDTLSMVDVNHPVIHQIAQEKMRQHGSDWKMHDPDQNGLYQVANADIERHIKFLREDWSKSIKMRDLMDLRIEIERATVSGKNSGDDLETIWANPAEICDGFDLKSVAGKKAREKITKSNKKCRLFLTFGIEYANVF